jgi:hypothetical protein
MLSQFYFVAQKLLLSSADVFSYVLRKKCVAIKDRIEVITFANRKAIFNRLRESLTLRKYKLVTKCFGVLFIE